MNEKDGRKLDWIVIITIVFIIGLVICFNTFGLPTY